MQSWRTDLALEVRESFEEDEVEISGVTVQEEHIRNRRIKVTTVEILNDEGAAAMGKPCGSYITMEIPELLNEEEKLKDAVEKELALMLKRLLKGKKQDGILVIGLGNREITADALGPAVVDGLLVTRHFFREFGEGFGERHGYRKVSALVPGVMAQTGMETMEIIQGIVKETKPDIVIAIDALAAKSVKRLNTTIQLTDTGISPGAGIGNNRQALNQESLGCPVIALGIPTVVDAKTIVREGVEQFAKKRPDFLAEVEKFLEKDCSAYVKNMFVTPKNIDCSIEYVSDTVAGGINLFIKDR